MTSESLDELAHLEQLAVLLQRRRRILEIQRVRFGDLVPAAIVLELEDTEQQLAQIHADVRRMRPGPTDAHNPYLGLLTFQEDDSSFFFGRDALIGELLGRAEHTSFLAVLGPSGSGKSSAVRAGLIPALKRGALLGSEMWSYLAPLKPGTRPLNALAATLAAAQAGRLGNIASIYETLRNKPDALLLLADGLLAGQTNARLVLVVDQAEELWTLAPIEPAARTAFLVEQQQPFIDCLLAAAAAADHPVLILLTMRADFLHRALEHQELATWTKTRNVLVEPLTRDELQSAIIRPAELVGADFEPGLVDTLVEQTLSRPGALPLLEYTLLELWKDRRSDSTLTWEAFKRIGGGVEGGLARRADTVLATQYTAEQQGELRAVLLRLVQPGEGTADTRRRVLLDDLVPAGSSSEAVQALLKPLADERLITTGYDPESDEEIVEVSHEALIRAWPTLGGWITAARGDLRLQIQLEEDAKDWVISGENRDLLWSGLRLDTAKAWLDRARPRLNARDQRFLDASAVHRRVAIEAEQARTAAEEAARQRELKQAQALAASAVHLKRRALYLGVALVATLIVATAAGWFWYRATIEEQRAFAQYLVAKGQAVYEDRPLLGVRLAIEGLAWLPEDDPARTDVISLTAQLIKQGRLTKIASDTTNIYARPGNDLFILTHNNAPSELWHTANTIDGTMLGGAVRAVWFGLDSKLVIVAYADKPNELRRADGSTVAFDGDIQGVSFKSDSTMFYVDYNDKPNELWRADGNIVPLTRDTNNIWFSPDSKQVVVAYTSEPNELWRADGSIIPIDARVDEVWFSPDSQLVVVGYTGKPSELWHADGSTVQLGGKVSFVLFSPNSQLAHVSYFDRPSELRRADGSIVPLAAEINNLWFSPDSQLVYVGYYGKLGELRPDDSSIVPLASNLVRGVWFSPDSKLVIINYADQPDELWRADGSSVLLDEIQYVQFSPDSQLAIIDYYDKPGELRRADGSSIALAGLVIDTWFSPDNRLAIVRYTNDTGELWETQSAPRRLAVIPHLSHFVYDTKTPYLIAQYSTGETYILDIPWLSATADNATAPVGDEVIKQACAGPLASPLFDERELQQYIENRTLKACR